MIARRGRLERCGRAGRWFLKRTILSGAGGKSKAGLVIFVAQITSASDLFRDRGARAALPQNCSPVKVNLGQDFANSTVVPPTQRQSAMRGKSQIALIFVQLIEFQVRR